jgi:hypothetical protein
MTFGGTELKRSTRMLARNGKNIRPHRVFRSRGMTLRLVPAHKTLTQ